MPKGLGRGYFFQGEHLTPEPAHPVAVAFIDGQNLFHAVREAPTSASAPNRRGIDKTDWIRIDRATYDACLDRRDYRRKQPLHSGGSR